MKVRAKLIVFVPTSRDALPSNATDHGIIHGWGATPDEALKALSTRAITQVRELLPRAIEVAAGSDAYNFPDRGYFESIWGTTAVRLASGPDSSGTPGWCAYGVLFDRGTTWEIGPNPAGLELVELPDSL